MVRIPKDVRCCCYPIVSFGISLLICKGLQYLIGVWAYLLFLPLFFWFHQISSPVDAVDTWLRKRTVVDNRLGEELEESEEK